MTFAYDGAFTINLVNKGTVNVSVFSDSLLVIVDLLMSLLIMYIDHELPNFLHSYIIQLGLQLRKIVGSW